MVQYKGNITIEFVEPGEDSCAGIERQTGNMVVGHVTDSVTGAPVSGASFCLGLTSITIVGYDFQNTTGDDGYVDIACSSALLLYSRALVTADGYYPKVANLPPNP